MKEDSNMTLYLCYGYEPDDAVNKASNGGPSEPVATCNGPGGQMAKVTELK